MARTTLLRREFTCKFYHRATIHGKSSKTIVSVTARDVTPRQSLVTEVKPQIHKSKRKNKPIARKSLAPPLLFLL